MVTGLSSLVHTISPENHFVFAPFLPVSLKFETTFPAAAAVAQVLSYQHHCQDTLVLNSVGLELVLDVEVLWIWIPSTIDTRQVVTRIWTRIQDIIQLHALVQ